MDFYSPAVNIAAITFKRIKFLLELLGQLLVTIGLSSHYGALLLYAEYLQSQERMLIR